MHIPVSTASSQFPTERPLFAVSMRLLAAGAITGMFALVKYLETRGVNLAEMMFYRQLFAIPVVWALLAWTVGPLGFRHQRLLPHISRTALGLIGMLFNFLSVSLLPLAESTTLTFTSPIFATILSAIILRERTGVHRWSAVALGFVGVLVITQPGGAHFPLIGLLVGICSALSVACVSIVLRDLAKSAEPAVIVFWFSILSLPPMGLLLIHYGHWHSANTFALIVMLGVLGGIGQILLTSALRWGPVSLVMPMDYSSILWATLFGWLIWHDIPPVSTGIGAALIVSSGLYIVWREHRLGRDAMIRAKAEADIRA